jgi:hypothetical protein
MDLNLEWGKPLPLVMKESDLYWADAEKIPEKPGIYVFFREFGDSRDALYVGQAGNLKKRIQQQPDGAGPDRRGAIRKCKDLLDRFHGWRPPRSAVVLRCHQDCRGRQTLNRQPFARKLSRAGQQTSTLGWVPTTTWARWNALGPRK